MIVRITGTNMVVKKYEAGWCIAKPGKKKPDVYHGFAYYPTLDGAIGKAYELALMDMDVEVDLSEVPAVCKSLKDALLEEVRKAVNNG